MNTLHCFESAIYKVVTSPDKIIFLVEIYETVSWDLINISVPGAIGLSKTATKILPATATKCLLLHKLSNFLQHWLEKIYFVLKLICKWLGSVIVNWIRNFTLSSSWDQCDQIVVVNIWPFATMKICPKFVYNLAKWFPNKSSKIAKAFNFLPKWHNLAKFGHTACDSPFWNFFKISFQKLW